MPRARANPCCPKKDTKRTQWSKVLQKDTKRTHIVILHSAKDCFKSCRNGVKHWDTDTYIPTLYKEIASIVQGKGNSMLHQKGHKKDTKRTQKGHKKDINF